MPLDTRRVDVNEEIESLKEERDGVAEKVADADPESNATQQLVQQGQRLDRYISGLAWYAREYEDSELVLGALTNGERHRVRDTADRIGETDAARQNAYVAHGVTEAAFLKHDADAVIQEAFEESIRAVADMHPAFVDWLEKEITDLGRLGSDTGKSFSELVLAKQTQRVSPENNG